MDKPSCAPTAPDLSQGPELLRKLLTIELERLETAVRIERERKIVFPETTIIIRDILRLTEALNAKPGKKSSDADPVAWLAEQTESQWQ